jgi:PHD/YefM family antitoxin component YafN of YafNO toxin-antitoxin module
MLFCVHTSSFGPLENREMAIQKVGIREFRKKLAAYLLESDEAVAITRRGDTVGYYIPAPSEAERAALRGLSAHVQRAFQKALKAEGISEDELLKHFRQLRRSR